MRGTHTSGTNHIHCPATTAMTSCHFSRPLLLVHFNITFLSVLLDVNEQLQQHKQLLKLVYKPNNKTPKPLTTARYFTASSKLRQGQGCSCKMCCLFVSLTLPRNNLSRDRRCNQRSCSSDCASLFI